MQVSNLTHPTMQAKIFAMMQRARLKSLKTGAYGEAFLRNKKGKVIAYVMHSRTNYETGFTFRNVKGEEITQNVLTSLRA